jgi:tRNA uridine 5-carboxymethylaminomethyl modification enzyme
MFTGVIEGGLFCRYSVWRTAGQHRLPTKTATRFFWSLSLTTHEYYPNGISTSLPFDIQYVWSWSHPWSDLENACRAASCTR